MFFPKQANQTLTNHVSSLGFANKPPKPKTQTQKKKDPIEVTLKNYFTRLLHVKASLS